MLMQRGPNGVLKPARTFPGIRPAYSAPTIRPIRPVIVKRPVTPAHVEPSQPEKRPRTTAYEDGGDESSAWQQDADDGNSLSWQEPRDERQAMVDKLAKVMMERKKKLQARGSLAGAVNQSLNIKPKQELPDADSDEAQSSGALPEAQQSEAHWTDRQWPEQQRTGREWSDWSDEKWPKQQWPKRQWPDQQWPEQQWPKQELPEEEPPPEPQLPEQQITPAPLPDVLTPETVEKGMVVIYDDDRRNRGWVDTCLVDIDQFWVRRGSDGEYVMQASRGRGSRDIRAFAARELRFAGEWSKDVAISDVIEVPQNAALRGFLKGEVGKTALEDLQEEAQVTLAVDEQEDGSCYIVVGPGLPPSVKQAIQTLKAQFEDFVTGEVFDDLVQSELEPQRKTVDEDSGKSQLPAPTEDERHSQYKIGEIKDVRLLKKKKGYVIVDIDYGVDLYAQVVTKMKNLVAGLKIIYAPEFSIVQGKRVAATTIHDENSVGVICTAADMDWDGDADECILLCDACTNGEFAPASQTSTLLESNEDEEEKKAKSSAQTDRIKKKLQAKLKDKLREEEGFEAYMEMWRKKKAEAIESKPMKAVEPDDTSAAAALAEKQTGADDGPPQLAEASISNHAEDQKEPAAAAAEAGGETRGAAAIETKGTDKETAADGNKEIAAEEHRVKDADQNIEKPWTVQNWQEKQEELFGHLPQLPPGWIRIKGKSGGIYFMHIETGQQTVVQPQFEFASSMPPLPPGWQVVRSQSGKTYYWHAATNHSTFEFPHA